MSRQEAIRHLEAARLMLLGKNGQPISDLYDALSIAIEALEQPTVDAVQVVRCKECKWFDAYGDTYDPYCDHKNHRHEVRNDFFCADGERRSDEQQTQGSCR